MEAGKNLNTQAVRRHVYELIALVTLLGAIAFSYGLWQQVASQQLLQRANDYHLASSSHYLKAMGLLRHAQNHLGFKMAQPDSSVDLSGIIMGPDHNFSDSAVFYLLRQEIQAGINIHLQFRGSEFNALSNKLARELEAFEAENKAYFLEGELSKRIAGDIRHLLITLQQLEVLHSVTRAALLDRFGKMQQRNRYVMILLFLLLLVTGFLISRKSFNSLDLLVREQEHSAHLLLESEIRFRNLFENSQVSVWDEDFSEVYRALDQLRNTGIEDLSDYLLQNPDELKNIISLVKVNRVNAATVKLFKAKNEQEFLSQIDRTFGPGALQVFENSLLAYWNGEASFRAEANFRALDGQIINAIISFIIPETDSGYEHVAITIVDVSDRKEALRALVENQVLLKEAQTMAHMGNWELDPVTMKAIWSEEVFAMFGLDIIDDAGPACLETILHPDDRDRVIQSLVDALKDKTSHHLEYRIIRPDGEMRWVECQAVKKYDANGQVLKLRGVIQDITLRKQQEEHILHQAHFDNLTNLPNRFLSLDRLAQLMEEARRENHQVAVLFLDLDDFKKVNDTLGHETGDKLLVEASERLLNVIRAGDTVGRFGGDEFIVLLGGLANAEDALPVAESLLNRFRDAFRIDERELMITLSLGIAIYPGDGESASELLRNADSAMYHSKQIGRNTYSYFTEEMNRNASQRLAIEEQMHGAIDRGEFSVFYQPQITVSSGQIKGAEALLRWKNPALGDISPVEFIPIAEQTGLIVKLGEFVLTEALKKAKLWQQQYDEEFCMAVNLSPRQFRDVGLVAFVKRVITQSGVKGDSVTLEITEGVLMSGHGYIDKSIDDLNALGVNIAMDDFGTGYSSLSYLRRYPFDVLKIDKSFIRDIGVDQADRELISAAVAMSHELNLKVVAEGVETQQQYDYLVQLGCDYVQGYLFGKPMPDSDFSLLLSEKTLANKTV